MTHFGNAMKPLHHRDAGRSAGARDGRRHRRRHRRLHHLSPRCSASSSGKGPERVALISTRSPRAFRRRSRDLGGDADPETAPSGTRAGTSPEARAPRRLRDPLRIARSRRRGPPRRDRDPRPHPRPDLSGRWISAPLLNPLGKQMRWNRGPEDGRVTIIAVSAILSRRLRGGVQEDVSRSSRREGRPARRLHRSPLVDSTGSHPRPRADHVTERRGQTSSSVSEPT